MCNAIVSLTSVYESFMLVRKIFWISKPRNAAALLIFPEIVTDVFWSAHLRVKDKEIETLRKDADALRTTTDSKINALTLARLQA